MLDSLLTLLPYWVAPDELEFHLQFVHHYYRSYYDILSTIGLRDGQALARLKEKTAYSMTILLWQRPLVWVSYVLFHAQLKKLKSLVPPATVHKFLKFPY
jgi:hypothetical protein